MNSQKLNSQKLIAYERSILLFIVGLFVFITLCTLLIIREIKSNYLYIIYSKKNFIDHFNRNIDIGFTKTLENISSTSWRDCSDAYFDIIEYYSERITKASCSFEKIRLRINFILDFLGFIYMYCCNLIE